MNSLGHTASTHNSPLHSVIAERSVEPVQVPFQGLDLKFTYIVVGNTAVQCKAPSTTPLEPLPSFSSPSLLLQVCSSPSCLTYPVKQLPSISILQQQVVGVSLRSLTKELHYIRVTQHLHDTHLHEEAKSGGHRGRGR